MKIGPLSNRFNVTIKQLHCNGLAPSPHGGPSMHRQPRSATSKYPKDLHIEVEVISRGRGTPRGQPGHHQPFEHNTRPTQQQHQYEYTTVLSEEMQGSAYGHRNHRGSARLGSCRRSLWLHSASTVSAGLFGMRLDERWRD
jgi:hypothetical protein